MDNKELIKSVENTNDKYLNIMNVVIYTFLKANGEAMCECNKIMHSVQNKFNEISLIESAINDIDYKTSFFGKHFIESGYNAGSTLIDVVQTMTEVYLHNNFFDDNLTKNELYKRIADDALEFLKRFLLEQKLREMLPISQLSKKWDTDFTKMVQFSPSKAIPLYHLYKYLINEHVVPFDCPADYFYKCVRYAHFGKLDGVPSAQSKLYKAIDLIGSRYFKHNRYDDKSPDWKEFAAKSLGVDKRKLSRAKPNDKFMKDLNSIL